MKSIFAFIALFTFLTNDTGKIDFGKVKSNSWTGVSENSEMVSAGTVSYSSETVRLTGYKESEDNVGSSLIGPKLDFSLSDYKIIEVKYRAKGAAISLLLQIDLDIDSKKFLFPFENTTGEWQTVQIPIAEFIDVNSSDLKNISKNQIKNINRLSFLTSNDYTGPYALEVDYIEFL